MDYKVVDTSSIQSIVDKMMRHTPFGKAKVRINPEILANKPLVLLTAPFVFAPG